MTAGYAERTKALSLLFAAVHTMSTGRETGARAGEASPEIGRGGSAPLARSLWVPCALNHAGKEKRLSGSEN